MGSPQNNLRKLALKCFFFIILHITSHQFNPPKRMKIGAILLVVIASCAYVGVEGRPRVLSANVKKGINTFLDEILNILAEERNAEGHALTYEYDTHHGSAYDGYPRQNGPKGFGKILVVGGKVGDKRVGDVWLIDPEAYNFEKPLPCQLNLYPDSVELAAGGLIATANGPRPLVCGGQSDDIDLEKCYILAGDSRRQWQENHTLSTGGTFAMAGVPLDPHWMFFSGGSLSPGEPGSPLKTTFIFNGQDYLSLPDLHEAREGPCAVILQDGHTEIQVGVLGGANFRSRGDPPNDVRIWGSMERYNCKKGKTPKCTKDTDGPAMNKERYNFGCGALQTSQGGRVLLALPGAGIANTSTEILDLSHLEHNNWTTLPTDMDLPEGEHGRSYSFVTSDTDPTTGYFMPHFKDYVYRVTCADSTSCAFVKVNIGQPWFTPRDPVTMTIQPDSGLNCGT